MKSKVDLSQIWTQNERGKDKFLYIFVFTLYLHGQCTVFMKVMREIKKKKELLKLLRNIYV